MLNKNKQKIHIKKYNSSPKPIKRIKNVHSICILVRFLSNVSFRCLYPCFPCEFAYQILIGGATLGICF